jgi:predicted metal-dependent phosphoesterase TrpH
MAYFDGHLHTTASDGLDAPAALVDRVARSGARAFALTDHDTFAGQAAAAARAAERGLELVPGVELSVALDGREIHVLAYWVGPEHRELAAALDEAAASRRGHLPRALGRLAELGMPLAEADVLAEAGGHSVGRPHIARAMLKRGYVTSIDQAFARWLGNGKPGHVPRPALDAGRMVRLVREAGGVCAAAHPGVYDLGTREIDRLQQLGVRGIEVYHPDHSPAQQLEYLRHCERLRLVPTGGSDDHGVPEARVHAGQLGLDQAGFLRLAAARPQSPQTVRP